MIEFKEKFKLFGVLVCRVHFVVWFWKRKEKVLSIGKEIFLDIKKMANIYEPNMPITFHWGRKIWIVFAVSSRDENRYGKKFGNQIFMTFSSFLSFFSSIVIRFTILTTNRCSNLKQVHNQIVIYSSKKTKIFIQNKNAKRERIDIPTKRADKPK